MARTQAADYEQRREDIVEKAAALYARHGFLGASVADLAEACGSAKSLIYHYFASKEDILFEVMASHIEALGEAVEQVRSTHAPAAERLRMLTRAFMRLYVGAADRHKVLLNELDRLPAARRAEIVERQRALVSAVEALLAELRPDLNGDRARLRPLAMLFFGTINWTHTWYDPAGPATPEQVADMAADLVLGGVGAV
ncbi:MAG TPA: TetR/AcrR family transcriptional regulator [Caulobacteraceae bacterium]|nr:TetR/AcrR family transcriptional regulator [Caulobacteraceae bacterium]